MFRRTNQPGPVGSFIGAIMGTAFALIFIVVGSSMALYGYVKYNDAGVYGKTPLVAVSDLKEGQIAKFILKSQSINNYEAPYSKNPCVFYRLEYISYSTDSDGDLTSSIDDIKSEPDQLTLESKDKNYLVSLVKPKADLYFKNTFTYLKNWKTKQYELAKSLDFRSGDYVLKEYMIAPDEDVLLFGQVKKIVPDSSNGLISLEFQCLELTDPFQNAGLFYTNLFKAFFSNELTSYFVSTKSDADLEEELNSLEGSMGIMLFGFAFCIIPLIIILVVWSSFIKSILCRL